MSTHQTIMVMLHIPIRKLMVMSNTAMSIKTARITPIPTAKSSCKNNLMLIPMNMFTPMSIHMVILSTPIPTVTPMLTLMATWTPAKVTMGTKRWNMPTRFAFYNSM